MFKLSTIIIVIIYYCSSDNMDIQMYISNKSL